MRPPDPRTVRSRESALTAARALLIDQGLAGITHGAVAARSGLSRATLYRLWPEPADLVRATLTLHIERARPASTGDLRADLCAALSAARAMLHEPVTEQGMRVMIERAGVDPAFAEVKEALYQAGTRSVREILTAAVDRGELPARLDVDLGVDLLLGPLFFRRLVAHRAFGDDHVHAVVDDFLRGRPPRHPTPESA